MVNTVVAIHGDWKQQLKVSVDKKTGKKTIYPTRENIITILNNDPKLKGIMAYNIFTNEIIVNESPPWKRSSDNKSWSDKDDSQLRIYLEINYEINSVQKIEDACVSVFENNSFHPIRDYLNDLTWDGMPRIDSLLIEIYDAEDSLYTRVVTRKSIIGAVARILDPGCKFDYVLTLVGPKGIGKSAFPETLAGAEYFSDNLTLNDMNNKTGAEHLQGIWILELAELAGMKRAEVDNVKSFVTRRVEKYRPAYGKRNISRPRQCIFIGSTNEELGFIRDPTGERRFWPVSVWKNGMEACHAMDRDQIWAEAVHAYKNGEELFLSKEMEELAKEIQESHIMESPLNGQIEMFLEDKKMVCASMIWHELLLHDKKDSIDAYKTREFNVIISQIAGWKKYDGSKNGRYLFRDYGKQVAFVKIETC